MPFAPSSNLTDMFEGWPSCRTSLGIVLGVYVPPHLLTFSMAQFAWQEVVHDEQLVVEPAESPIRSAKTFDIATASRASKASFMSTGGGVQWVRIVWWVLFASCPMHFSRGGLNDLAVPSAAPLDVQ